MQERAHGIILRVYPLTETSLIVQWLTRERGRMATVAKGARKPKSNFAGKLDIFVEADFAFVPSRKSQLHTLSEVQVLETHPYLRKDLGALTQAAYCAALIEQTTEQETPLHEAFLAMKEILAVLAVAPASPSTLCLFELLWLQSLGQRPEAGEGRLSPNARAWIESALEQRWGVLREALPPAQQRELASFLHGFIIYHLGRIPRNRGGALAFEAGPF